MIALCRSAFEGLFSGAVMSGLSPTPGATLHVNIAAGIAIGPTGYLMVQNDITALTFVAPGSNTRKDLVVIRPLLTNASPITRPTSPFDTVYLTTLQDCQVVVIAGTSAASPVYPAIVAGDIVLCGVRIATGQTTFVASDFDLEVKDLYGKNSDFQQNFGKYDDRLRPFRSAFNVLGLKPSQLSAPHPKAFTYVNQTAPSIFPNDGAGNYVDGDTLLNLLTGAITGSDGLSADFTPSIPAAGNWINATVALKTDDTLSVTYGTAGTRAQCVAGILNQKTTAAGCVGLPTNQKIICFLTVYSSDGATINEFEITDARSLSAVAGFSVGILGGGTSTPIGGAYPLTLTSSYNGKVVYIDSSAARTINLPAPVDGFKVTFQDKTGTMGTFNTTIHRFAAETIMGLAADFVLEASWGVWTFVSDGTNWFIM